MPQKIINVKPIKNKAVLSQFASELLKINMGKEIIQFSCLVFLQDCGFQIY